MVAADYHDFGLELTQNSKVGWAFSLSRKESCINATEVCLRCCYGNGVTYASAAQRHKRTRNFKTCIFLLEKGGPDLLAQNLIALVDQARPVDWLPAQISGQPTRLPWTLRIHDVGDVFSREYAEAWLITIQNRPQCSFWFYTRSFLDEALLETLSLMASQPNCQGLLSIDNDNFEQGLTAFASYPGVWKLALLQQAQDELSVDLIPAIQGQVKLGEIVNFPYHRAGRHAVPLKLEPLTQCPQITT
ncbi:MAG: hypothetical protein K2X81_24515, partial [Candidatus Obscuribacterales bacterium]|nr:hypothetical protein [Candidatus Obscuribacterales bacterium]